MDKKICEENQEIVVSCWGHLVHLFSGKRKLQTMRTPRKHKSRAFRYSPLSYSRNFEDYWRDEDDFDDSSLRSFSSSFPIVDIQSFDFPISYELQRDQFNTNLHDFQQDYSSINYADDSKLGIDQSIVLPSIKDEPNVGFYLENESKNKMKKVSGQPSKNLMAERRRRKRLNDRLSMLRSVVPKISKMDRTSMLGDTIDYMKELLERINNLQEELMEDGGANLNDEINVVPKMEVEKMRGNGETRIKISCAMKPGLLLSTMKTVEESGLEIQQCVISCFSDFTMQASCSQATLLF